MAPPPDWEFTEMEAAAEWGIPPSQWRSLPEDDRARMVTHRILRNVRSAYEAPDPPKLDKAGGGSGVGGREEHPLLKEMKLRNGMV